MASELNNTNEDYQYVFIIGAAKCGTTALADLLDQHSNICLSYPKEPDFFTTRIYRSEERRVGKECSFVSGQHAVRAKAR